MDSVMENKITFRDSFINLSPRINFYTKRYQILWFKDKISRNPVKSSLIP